MPYMTTRQMDGGIKRVASGYKELNGLIQEIGVSIINHAVEHGDCNRALRLVQAMPKGSRRNQLIRWFGAANIMMNVDEGNVRMKKADSKTFNKTPLDFANTTPWFEYEKEKAPPTAMTLEEARDNVLSFTKRLRKRAAEEGVNEADRAGIEQLCATIEQQLPVEQAAA